MKISFENPDKINGLLTLVVEEEDYKNDVENLIINCDVIIINLVATIESYLELWSNSDIKHKCERSTILQVSWLLLL